MVALGGQRFVGVSQADETRGEHPSSAGRAVRTKRVNHAIKQEDRAFSTCTVRVKTLQRRDPRVKPVRMGGNLVIRAEGRGDYLISYQRPEGLTGMRAGLASRLRAKSIRNQRPANSTKGQYFGPLVSVKRDTAMLLAMKILHERRRAAETLLP
jgi:hypothetical protein